MSTLTKPYGFTGGQFAVASQVNADFDTIYSWINGGGAVWNDGSVAFTNLVTGPNLDPLSGNHLTRKSYVDNRLTLYVNGTLFSGAGSGLRVVAGTPTFNYTTGGYNLLFPIAFNTVPVVLVTPGKVAGTATDCDVQSTSSTSVILKVMKNGIEANNGNSFTVSYIAIGT